MVSGEKMIEKILEHNDDLKYDRTSGKFVKKEMIVDSFDFEINGEKYSFDCKYFGIDGKRCDEYTSVKENSKVQYFGAYQRGELERTLIDEGMAKRGFHHYKDEVENKDINKEYWYEVKKVNRCEKI
jgi:hypothetical protein